MKSQALSVIERVERVLTNSTDAGEQVFVHLESALEREESPAIVIELVSEDPSPWANGFLLNQLKFRLLFVARDNNWQTKLSTLRTQAHALLCADADLNQLLSGLHRERMEVQSSSADLPVSLMSQIYAGQYVSNTNELHSFTNSDVA